MLQVSQDSAAYGQRLYEQDARTEMALLRKNCTVTVLTPQQLQKDWWDKAGTRITDMWLKACTDKGVGTQAKQIMDILTAARQ